MCWKNIESSGDFVCGGSAAKTDGSVMPLGIMHSAEAKHSNASVDESAMRLVVIVPIIRVFQCGYERAFAESVGGRGDDGSRGGLGR